MDNPSVYDKFSIYHQPGHPEWLAQFPPPPQPPGLVPVMSMLPARYDEHGNVLAACLVPAAKLRAGMTIMDPCCGPVLIDRAHLTHHVPPAAASESRHCILVSLISPVEVRWFFADTLVRIIPDYKPYAPPTYD